MSKQTLPTGQDNVIVRDQKVYGFLPKDVIDRLGDTSTQLATEDQTALGAINELKSDLTEFDDYIIDEGIITASTVDWNYRKYKSGIAECWCKRGASVSFTSWGQIFSADIDSIDYPFTFDEIPVVSAWAKYTYSAVSSPHCNGMSDNDLKSKTPKLTLVRGSSLSGSYSAVAFYRAIGKLPTT